jgi:hypothetical protein
MVGSGRDGAAAPREGCPPPPGPSGAARGAAPPVRPAFTSGTPAIGAAGLPHIVGGVPSGPLAP